jgi:nitroimidazol reductase NimA-like FMN-containing flavoprotein (pyridoxamine 5'-phosphate oxidase superfamily)
MQDERSMFALSRSESMALLTRSRVGRLVFTEHALPAVTPVPFAFLADEIVTHSSGDTGLAAAATRGRVLAFEVDDIDPAARTGWSVVVVGEPELVTSAEDRERIDHALAPWAPAQQDVCIRLPLTVVTGRRIASTRAVGPPSSGRTAVPPAPRSP